MWDEKSLLKTSPPFPNHSDHFQALCILSGFVFNGLEKLVDLPNLNGLGSLL